jgi:hypothetical protein
MTIQNSFEESLEEVILIMKEIPNTLMAKDIKPDIILN